MGYVFFVLIFLVFVYISVYNMLLLLDLGEVGVRGRRFEDIVMFLRIIILV